jgi:hypothetical protein
MKCRELLHWSAFAIALRCRLGALAVVCYSTVIVIIAGALLVWENLLPLAAILLAALCVIAIRYICQHGWPWEPK